MKRYKVLLLAAIMLLSVFMAAVVYATDVPGGTYTVGVDIPEGTYTVSVKKGSVNFTVWGAAYNDYRTNGGLLVNEVIGANSNIFDSKLGKVILRSGNVVNFGKTVTFEPYRPIPFNPSGRNEVPGGTYTVGVDIPAGNYTVSISKGSVNFTVWGAAYNDFRTNGGLLVNEVIGADSNIFDPMLGKVILQDGNVVNFGKTVIFEPYKGFTF